MRTLRARQMRSRRRRHPAPRPSRTSCGSIADRAVVDACMRGVDAVLHAATLHKPHVATHSRQDFVDTNVTGTLNLLEAAVAQRVRAFVFTSTTSTFRRRAHAAARRARGLDHRRRRADSRRTSTASPRSRPKICASCSIATSSCPAWCCAPRGSSPKKTTWPERAAFDRATISRRTNSCIGAWTSRTSSARICWRMDKAAALGFGKLHHHARPRRSRATTPRSSASMHRRCCERAFPDSTPSTATRGWTMLPTLDRVYVNDRARDVAGLAAAV